MRDITSWRRSLARQFRHWPEDARLDAEALCDVELALCMAQVLAPLDGASSVPALLSGYPFALGVSGEPTWSKPQQQVWKTARVLLTPFKNPSQWERALQNYRALPEYLRGYSIEEGEPIVARQVSDCPRRHETYHEVLGRPVAHRSRPVRWAGEGEHVFPAPLQLQSVVIPPELVFDPPTGHPSRSRAKRKPVRIAWGELEATARWMDEEEERRGVPEKERGDWQGRFKRLHLDLPDDSEGGSGASFKRAKTLEVNGRANFIGMVSAGKSTLMDVIAVWAAQHGLRITLVVGDVVSVLDRAQMFTRLGLATAPILGSSNRKIHINRMHRTLAGSDAALDPGAQFQHLGYRWLSTICPLDGLRSENNTGAAPHPLPLGKTPCLKLEAHSGREDEGEDEEEPRPPSRGEKQACPLYSACPFHQAQRDLVDANIWIATPASLVYTSVAPQLNAERVRFLEMACRRSDLVIVDEADQVQVQLDNIFNPSQTLVGPGGWLNWLRQRVAEQLNAQRHAPLAQENVGVWAQGHNTAQTAVDRIYHLIQDREDLRLWVEENNYFTSLTLFDHLAQVLEGEPDAAAEEEAGGLRAQFEACAANPLGEEGDAELCEIARLILASTHAAANTSRLRAWIEANRAPHIDIARDEANRLAARLELALLVAVLQNRVHHLLRHWSAAEESLKLEGSASLLSHLPPEDYRALLPEPAMGQVLAFQYVHSEGRSAGDLRFFRCMGVGRWALLHLHELFAGQGVAGPNVILLSGTSWAGSSPSYHLQAPVNGILRAPDDEVRAIEKSLFEFLPQHDREHRPIRVSGRQGIERTNALRTLLQRLAQKGQFGGTSILERERDRLSQGQQRVLLVVNSYEEAEDAYKYLCALRQDWEGQARYLVNDDRHFENEWHGGDGAEGHLRRGLVGELAQTGAWLLIAPLLAVERGHNILAAPGDSQDGGTSAAKAAIGAAFFLVRPHQRPDDIGFAVHSINHWAVERHADHRWLRQAVAERSAASDAECPLKWGEVGAAFREAGEERWRELLRLRMQYSTLPEAEREAVLWSQIVSMWQVIGRLVRGGSPARVFFCDAAFAPGTASAHEDGDRVSTSLLVGMREVLRPYFTPSSALLPLERALVQALYSPFYTALANVRNLPASLGGYVDADDDHDD